MSENVTEAAIGFLVLLVAGAFLYYLLEFRQTTDVGDTYEVSALFLSAEGISVGSEVRMAGIKVGDVATMEMDMDTYRARVMMNIDNQYPIPDDSFVTVAPESLLGGYFLNIAPGGSLFDVEPGGVLDNTQGYVSLLSILSLAFSSD